jgi:hypothetical protein
MSGLIVSSADARQALESMKLSGSVIIVHIWLNDEHINESPTIVKELTSKEK